MKSSVPFQLLVCLALCWASAAFAQEKEIKSDAKATPVVVGQQDKNSTATASFNSTSSIDHDHASKFDSALPLPSSVVTDEEVEHVIDDAFATAMQLAIANVLDEGLPIDVAADHNLLHITDDEIKSIKRCIGPSIHAHLHRCVAEDMHASLADPHHVPGVVVEGCVWSEEFDRIGQCFDHQQALRIEHDKQLLDRLSEEQLMRLVDEHGSEEFQHVRPIAAQHHYSPPTGDHRDTHEVEAFAPMLEHAGQLHHKHYRHSHHSQQHRVHEAEIHHHALLIPEDDMQHDQRQATFGVNAMTSPLPTPHEKDAAPKLVKRKYGYGPNYESLPGVRRGHPLP
jgi:hypothetical protein